MQQATDSGHKNKALAGSLYAAVAGKTKEKRENRTMTKKDFIALADAIRELNIMLAMRGLTHDTGTQKFEAVNVATAQNIVIGQLADFCESSNAAFNCERWLGYIAGENGRNGGSGNANQSGAIGRCGNHCGLCGKCAGRQRQSRGGIRGARVMTGVRFYLEYNSPRDKRKHKDSGNVFAAFVCNGRMRHGGYEGLGGVFDWANSAVASCSASLEFLRTHCRRVSEAKARMVHPALFERLDEAADADAKEDAA